MNNESNVNSYAKVFPTVFEFAEGATMTDTAGKKYLDFFSGAGALNYGHNNPAIRKAMIDFLEANHVIHCLDMDTRMKEIFLERFNEIILKPRKLNYKVQFTGPTGTNAVEASIKLARIVTGRKKIVAFTHSFHGMTATSLALSGSQENRHKVNPSQDILSFPYDQFLGTDMNTMTFLKTMIGTSGSGVELPAAIILETIQAEGGVNIAGIGWLQELREFTREQGILLIVDDIQVGCGRTGNFFSFERAGIVPDIVLLSKSISGFGLPLSLVLISPEFDVWKSGEHNGTFRSNNLSLCTASKALDYWQDDALEKSIAEKAAIISDRLQKMASVSAHIVAVRGMGMIWGVEFTSGQIACEVARHLFKDGMLIETCGNDDQVLKLLSPLTITTEELNAGLDKLYAAIAHVSQHHKQHELVAEPV